MTLQKTDVPDNSEPMHKAGEKVKNLKLPAVWYPHTMMGISTAGMVEDVDGNFGFKGQYYVSDQGHFKVMQMQLEKVNGQYQGACYPFREGWQSGLLRLSWGNDGSMFGGMTSRGWSSTGKDLFGLQRMVWNGKMPFEMAEIHAMSDGFELTFSKPIDKATAINAENYEINSFTYQYHHSYGSPVIQNKTHGIKAIIVSNDLTKVRLVLDESQRYFIHEIKPKGVKSKENEPLLHEFAYYTLNNIPTNAAADMSKNVMAAANSKTNTMGHAGHKMASTKPLSKKELRKKAEAERLSMKRQTTMPSDWHKARFKIRCGASRSEGREQN